MCKMCNKKELRASPFAGAANLAPMVQNSVGENASMAASRSATSRSATLCTRPADLAGGTLRQRWGLTVKPTR